MIVRAGLCSAGKVRRVDCQGRPMFCREGEEG